MSDPIPPIGVPVGTIIPYAADPTNLPSNWHVCNGSSYGKAQFSDLYNILGAKSDPFTIPDLQGRFLRGSDAPGTLTETSTTACPNPPITVRVNQMATTYNWTNKGGASSMIAWHGDVSGFSCSGGDKESRPVNVYFHYIIKLTRSTTIAGDDIPLGGLMPFGSGLSSTQQNFPEYVRCDGSKVDTAVLGTELYNLVGNKFTSLKQPGQFFAPDLTGKFIRGVDPFGSNDPDAGTRFSAPDGTRGIGTWQPYATAFRNPNVSVPHFSTYSRGTGYTAGVTNIQDGGYTNAQTWTSAALETRPSNAAIYHHIHSVDPTKSKKPLVFPIGGIIAIPGTSALPPTRGGSWSACDGSACATSDFPDLYDVIGTTWGGTPDRFLLPNLTDYFLRGPDIDGKPDCDPDWNKRTDILGKNHITGAGSYQAHATAMPQNKLQIPISYPTWTQQNIKAPGSPQSFYNQTAEADGAQTFNLSAAWDTETAPVNFAVKFYMRIY